MLCSQCHKNEAEVYFKQIVDNQVAQLVLCGDCAREKVLVPEEVESFLFKLLDALGGSAAARHRAAPRLQCDSCGLRWEDFLRSGRLGCPACYDAFEEPLSELLEQIHGATLHKGKRPARAGAASGTQAKDNRAEMERLRRDIQAAVSKEDFEKAAFLRDRLRELQK